MAKPTLDDSIVTITLDVDNPLPTRGSTNYAVHKIPGRKGEVIQAMGVNNERITVRGFTQVAGDISQFKTWKDDQTRLTYNDIDHTNVTVVIFDYESVRTPGIPSLINYSLLLLEVTQ